MDKKHVTIVTATDTKYLQKLELVYPNWCKYKQVDQYPMIVYVNGFDNPDTDTRLDFLRSNDNLEIIKWDFPQAKTQKERMVLAFVFGAARDVETDYFLKLDADAFFTNNYPLITDNMADYVIYGHRWGYTKPAEWIKQLDDWAKLVPNFNDKKPMYNEKNIEKETNRYFHKRLASYVCFHDKEFVEFAASLALHTPFPTDDEQDDNQIGKERLPVPSHDTYLWYVANQLGLKWGRTHFKGERGVTNCCAYKRIKQALETLAAGKQV